MKQYKCLIVDDEPLAINVIENHLSKFSVFKVVKTCTNALDAFEILNQEKIDLIFLDIQMPEITGIDFIKSLENKPQIIITTAFRDYAVDSYELDVLDYLVKPVSINRLLKAIQKFHRIIGSTTNNIISEIVVDEKEEFIYVKEGKRNVKIILNKILYIESLKDYVKFYLETGRVISKMSITNLEDILPEDNFIRVHRSFIVPVYKIKAYSASIIEIEGKKIPIGNTYKSPILKRLNFLAEK